MTTIDEDIAAISAAIRDLVTRVAEDTRQNTIKSIMAAATKVAAPASSPAPAPAPARSPLAGMFSREPPTLADFLTKPRTRAPRGSVRKVLDPILADHPGLTIAEIETHGERRNKEVAAKSYGNELRRLEGIRYRRNRPNGNRWFLMDGMSPNDPEDDPLAQTHSADVAAPADGS